MFSTKSLVSKDEAFFTYLNLLRNPVGILTYLYPKVYPLHLLDERHGNSVDQFDFQPGSKLDDGTTIMPDSLPCTIEALSVEGIYLVDEGEAMYLLIFECSKEDDIFKVEMRFDFQIFGVVSALEASQLSEMPYLEESPLNQKVHNMIEECRRLKSDYNHQLKFVLIE